MRSPRRARAERSPAATALADQRLTLEARPALAVILAGVILMLGGFAAAGPTLAVPGAGLVVIGLFAVLWVSAVAAGTGVSGQPVTATVLEGRQLALDITVSRPRLLRRGGAQLDHSLLRAPVPLDPHRDVLRLTAQARGRGRLVIAPPRLLVSDPFGLARAVRRGAGGTGELLVLPRTEPVRWLDADFTRNLAHADPSLGAGQATDVAGLRAYQPGTPATRIHWPALARNGTLLERVYAADAQLAPCIVVDPRLPPRSTDGELLDAVIRAVASLVLALARSGTVALLLPSRTVALQITPSLTTWPAVHRALALLPAAPASAAPPSLGAGREAVLFYACTDPDLAVAARQCWAGSLLILTPATAAVPTDVAIAPGASAATGRIDAVLEVAGCVARRSPGGVL